MRQLIFIHGALSTSRSFSFIKNGLNLRFDDKLLDLSYDIREERADSIADRFAIAVAKAAKSADELIYIGHSFGGVLAVDLTHKLGPLIKQRVISMSSPFGGSGVANVIRFLKPTSVFLQNVASQGQFMQGFTKRSLLCPTRGIITSEGGNDLMPSPNDGVVTVESQLHFKTAGDQLWSSSLVKLNHFEVLLSTSVNKLIQKELDR